MSLIWSKLSITAILLAKNVLAVRHQTVCLTSCRASQLLESNIAKSCSETPSSWSSGVGLRNWAWWSTMDRDRCSVLLHSRGWPGSERGSLFAGGSWCRYVLQVLLSVWYMWFLIICCRQNSWWGFGWEFSFILIPLSPEKEITVLEVFTALMFCMRIYDITEHNSLLVIRFNKLYVIFLAWGSLCL